MSDNEQTPANTTAGATTGTDIMQIVEHRPEIVLLQPESAELLFQHIEAEVEAFEPDMTTAKGRDACRALAAKVTKTKTTVDKSRLSLTEEARAKIKIINESGTKIKERLEALADRARAPLTAWEEAEEARLATCKAALERLRQAAIVPLDATAGGLRARIAEVQAEPMDEDRWQQMSELAETAKATALEALTAALAIVEQKEKDAAELVRLREEAAAREAQIEQERLAREEAKRADQEAQERAQREAREAEEAEARAAQDEAAREAERERQEQEAAANAEQQRLAAEQAATAAAERAREEEAARAAEQAAERERAHEAELAAERERAATAEREAQAERARRETEDRQRAEQEAAAAAERARLEKDRARRTRVMSEAKLAVMSCGVDEETARKVILAIMAGEVPRVILDFAAEPVATTKKDGELL